MGSVPAYYVHNDKERYSYHNETEKRARHDAKNIPPAKRKGAH